MFGPQNSGCKFRAASFGAAKFGPQVSGRKIRAAKFGPQVSGRKIRAAKFGPQVSGRNIQSSYPKTNQLATPQATKMNKWAATSLVLLIAILCGTIHGAVLREQQQPLDAVHQQAPDHINETEKTDTDNAKSEKPGPNPKTSEPEKSERYTRQNLNRKASGEQARKKRQGIGRFPGDTIPIPTTTTPKPTKPPIVLNGNGTDPKNTNISEITTSTPTTIVTPSASNETKGPMPFNTNGTAYEPKDNPAIKRNYTSESVYWDDKTGKCYSKENVAGGMGKAINDTLQFYGNLGLYDAKNYFGKEKATQKKEFSDMRDFGNGGFMQDMVLLLIDGRIECKSAKKDMDVHLAIVQDLEAGKISELCGEEKMHEFGNTTVTLDKGTSYFVFGVVLRERLCPHNKVPGTPPNNTGDLVIEELKYKYENVKLMVAHSCMGKKRVTIKLRPIDVFEMDRLDHVLQLRDLTLDLSMLVDDDVMLEKGAEMKDSKSGIYYLPSIGTGTDKNAPNPMVKTEKKYAGKFKKFANFSGPRGRKFVSSF
uniref:Uncharacterized protein n=1 Tax=Globodera rostochiensis TaxID=31243 RepID=A0A914HN83_GLORO